MTVKTPRRTQRPQVLHLPEGDVTVLRERAPVMVLVEQGRLVERMNPEFWSPRWGPIYEILLKRSPFPVRPLRDFIPKKVDRWGQSQPGITYGQVGHREYPPKGTEVVQGKPLQLRLPDGSQVGAVAYLQVRNVRRTGVDIYESPPAKRFIAEGSRNDILRSRLQPGDLLIVNSGVGSVGRTVVVPSDEPFMMNISQDIDRIVLEGIEPAWVAVFLQSRYGAAQMERWLAGVSGQVKIDFDEIRTLQIPVPTPELGQAVARAYRQMTKSHQRAMKAKKQEQSDRAERWLDVALGQLETLIAQVEWLLEGVQSDIRPLIPPHCPPRLASRLRAEYRRIGRLHRRLEQMAEAGERKSVLGIPSQRFKPVRARIRRVLHWIEAIHKTYPHPTM
jgi:hypothetical protein